MKKILIVWALLTPVFFYLAGPLSKSVDVGYWDAAIAFHGFFIMCAVWFSAKD